MGLCTQRSNVINKRDRNAMKQLKIWSIMMLMVFLIPTYVYSQEVDIDERDLVGSWNRVEAQGTFDGNMMAPVSH